LPSTSQPPRMLRGALFKNIAPTTMCRGPDRNSDQ